MSDMTQWIIVAFAVGCFIFNSGALWGTVRSNKKNIDKLWLAIDDINKYLRNKRK